MASLSNINGLFDVHSTGAILFSTSHGTSGQILRSNGNAAPTWVDSSTVIGGPYLPLTGGTLSGALAGTSATFSGTLTGQANSNTFGTASASGRALIVQAGSSNQAIMLKNNLGGDGTISATGTATTMNYSFGTYSVAPALFIQNNGNIGIGTATPSSFSGYTNLSLKAGSTGNNLDFFNSAGTRIGAIVTDGSDDVILEASGLSRNLIFKTDNAGTFSEKMRITGDGIVNVGGTIGNGSRFNVIGTTNTSVGYNQMNIANANGAWGLLLGYGNGLLTTGYHGLNHAAIINVQSAPLHLGTSNSAKLTILANGNVGIGTVSPGEALTLASDKNIRLNWGGASEQYIELHYDANYRMGLKFLGNPRILTLYNYRSDGADTELVLRDGNVGIGTTVPITKLSVHNSTETTGITDVLTVTCATTNTASAGKGAAIRIGREPDGNYSTKIATVYEQNNPSYLNPAMVFYTMYNSYLPGSEVERMRITSVGRILMPGLDGKTQVHPDVSYRTSDGELFYQTSSIRYKKDIINLENSLNKINSLRPVRFTDINTNEPSFGLIAEETNEIIPDVVFTKDEQIEGISYSNLTPFLIKAIQELEARIKELENK